MTNDTVFINNEQVRTLALALNQKILKIHPHHQLGVNIYPIPRGGIPAAYMLCSVNPEVYNIVDDIYSAHFCIDDIIDSGETALHFAEAFQGIKTYALIDKTDEKCQYKNNWIIWPWEQSLNGQLDNTIVGTITNRIISNNAPFHANDNISKYIMEGELDTLQNEIESRAEHLLKGLIIDVNNDHNTKGTAKRIAKMYLREVFKGRYTPPPTVTDFPNAKQLDELYTVGPISIRSACSHHFVPIIGKCWIGIIPSDRVIGISKFNRIVDWIASRPQIQEEFAIQVADYIQEAIQPKGLAVVIEATHMCMTWRGVKEPNTTMNNSVMRGIFRDKPEARAEFMSLIKSSN